MASGPSGKSVNESLDNQRPIRNAAIDGLAVLDENATLTFTLFKRVVLPADGFVFWLRADILNQPSVYNAAPFNVPPNNTPPQIVTPAQTFDAAGSLHHTTLNQQDEAESFSLQKMVFTTPDEVDQLTSIAPDELWIAEWSNLRFAFSSRTGFYYQAGLYHYAGDALYPALATQVIDSPEQLEAKLLIVSNSLPIWLTLQTAFPLYPSYLVPDNITPPYASIQIGDDDTSPLQNAPNYDATNSSWQLCKDRVRIVTYGVRNDAIMDWLDYVFGWMLANTSVMGLMNQPVPRDAKRGQTEFSILAQKKVIDFEVSYYQHRGRDQARQLIETAFLALITQPFALPKGKYLPVLV
jgi:hypothetical protein